MGMRKVFCLILLFAVFSVCLSACTAKPKASLIKSQRRLEKYIQPQETRQGGTVDLSEGPRLRYEANFGPKVPNFDFKIENPY